MKVLKINLFLILFLFAFLLRCVTSVLLREGREANKNTVKNVEKNVGLDMPKSGRWGNGTFSYFIGD